VVVTGVSGFVGAFVGVRLWRGLACVPLEQRKGEDRLAPLTITVIPGSIFMLSLSLGSLMLLLRDSTANEVAAEAALVVALAMAAAAVLGVVLIVSLVFFTRPLWILLPHIRPLIEKR
jgi:hypothetical protein